MKNCDNCANSSRNHPSGLSCGLREPKFYRCTDSSMWVEMESKTKEPQMTNAKIRLQDWNGTTVMQCLEIKDELRGAELLFKGSLLEIWSKFNTSLTSDDFGIHLQGKSVEDDSQVACTASKKYVDVLNTFKEWGIELAKRVEVSDGVLYKWFFEYTYCEDRDCDFDCALYNDSENNICGTGPRASRDVLLAAYHKANAKDTTTFKWVDEAQGIFTV